MTISPYAAQIFIAANSLIHASSHTALAVWARTFHHASNGNPHPPEHVRSPCSYMIQTRRTEVGSGIGRFITSPPKPAPSPAEPAMSTHSYRMGAYAAKTILMKAGSPLATAISAHVLRSGTALIATFSPYMLWPSRTCTKPLDYRHKAHQHYTPTCLTTV